MENDNTKDIETTKQETITPPELRNPTGKGGFGDNPQNRNNGAWKKTETFRYWFNLFKEMRVEAFKKWQLANPEETRSVASNLAFTRVFNALTNLKEFQEVANRSEGMPKQTIETNDVGTDYQKYLELCNEYKIDPKTGLRLDS